MAVQLRTDGIGRRGGRNQPVDVGEVDHLLRKSVPYPFDIANLTPQYSAYIGWKWTWT